MPSPIRAKDSLRGLGYTTIAVDKPTASRLKRLAGDTPLCQKVRELVELGERVELGGGIDQVPLDGQERLLSENTIPALAQGLSQLRSEVRSMADLLGSKDARELSFLAHTELLFKCLTFNPFATVAELRAYLDKEIEALKQNKGIKVEANNTQLELFTEG